MKLPKSIRLVLISFLIANVLFFILHSFVSMNVIAQQNDSDSNLLQNDWGLALIFAEGTTLTEANHLRLEYGLELRPIGYIDNNGVNFRYVHNDDSSYPNFASVFYAMTNCVFTPKEGKTLCPIITPVEAYYEPVSEEIEAALLADDRVAQLDNRNNPVFFIFKMGIEFVKIIPHAYNRIMSIYVYK